MSKAHSLQYPIGEFDMSQGYSSDKITNWIDEIERTPGRLGGAVVGLTDTQLDTPYRPDGWTVRQVVHHLPDSHMNSYVRFKLAMTEESPTIRPYFEDRWGELADARTGPIDVSLRLLEALHERWGLFLRHLEPSDWGREFRHPELGGLTIGLNIGLYAWHGAHHIAHITELRGREGW